MTSCGGVGADNSKREKNWNELSDGEKLERTRLVTRNLQDTILGLRRTVNALKAHVHVEGKVYKRIDFDGGGELDRSRGTWKQIQDGEVYF